MKKLALIVGGVLGLGGIAYGLTRLFRRGSAGGGAGFDGPALATIGWTPAQIQTAAWFWDEWAKEGKLTPEQRIDLLAVAKMESGVNPKARSHPDLADEQFGGSYTAFQIRFDVLRDALKQDLAKVIPPKDTTGAALEPYARAQARAASAFARYNNWLSKMTAFAAGNVDRLAVEIGMVWGFGPGKNFTWALAQPANASLQGRIPDYATNAQIIEIMDEAKRSGDVGPVGSGTATALRKLQAARDIRRAWGIA